MRTPHRLLVALLALAVGQAALPVLVAARTGKAVLVAARTGKAVLVAARTGKAACPTGVPNAFYAMDTCTKRPYPKNDIAPAAQLDMLKELGYAGIAWTEEPVSVAPARRRRSHRGYEATVEVPPDPPATRKPAAVLTDEEFWAHMRGDALR